MFFYAALVLLFIIKIRFPKGKNIHHIIETRMLILRHNVTKIPGTNVGLTAFFAVLHACISMHVNTPGVTQAQKVNILPIVRHSLTGQSVVVKLDIQRSPLNIVILLHGHD